MAPYEMMEEVAVLLQEAYLQAPSMGTLGTKLVNGQVDDKNLAVLGLFEDAKVSCGVVKHISECPVAFAGEIRKKMDEVSPGRDDTVCIEYCTGSEEKLVTTFTSCLAQRGFIWQVVRFLESRMENSLLWHITERYMRMPVLMPLSKI